MHTQLNPLIARERASDRERRLARARRKGGQYRPPPKIQPRGRQQVARAPQGHRKAI